MIRVAEIFPAVMLDALTSKVLTEVLILALPPTRFPVACIVTALINPVDTMFPGSTFPTTIKLPLVEMLAVTVKLLRVPTDVILG